MKLKIGDLVQIKYDMIPGLTGKQVRVIAIEPSNFVDEDLVEVTRVEDADHRGYYYFLSRYLQKVQSNG